MLTFATALNAAGIDPAAVRLLRHHKIYPGGRTPYSLWATIAGCSSSTSPRKTRSAARTLRSLIRLRRVPRQRRRAATATRQPAASDSAPGSVAERFNALVRAMNAGRSNNGAWRSVLITAPDHSPQAHAVVVQGRTPIQKQGADGRLPAAQLFKMPSW